jgi:hypothetical protein
MKTKTWLSTVALLIVVGVSGCNVCTKNSDCAHAQICSEEMECIDPPKSESAGSSEGQPMQTPAPTPKRDACSSCYDACRGISGCSCCRECAVPCFN